MPNYRYECLNEGCGEIFEVVRSIKSDKEVDCPSCKQKCSNVLITGGAAIIDKTPRTLGTLAEQNTKKFGAEYCKQKEIENKKRSQLARKTMRELPCGERVEKPEETYVPFWRNDKKVDSSLASLTPQQKHKYVTTGEKPK